MTHSVLVVDDDANLATVMREVLESEGYAVRTARDGLAALDLARAATPDLVVTDIAMPRLDGIALARRLLGAGIPVMLLSAAITDPGLADVPFLAKPFDLDDLLALVGATIRGR